MAATLPQGTEQDLITPWVWAVPSWLLLHTQHGYYCYCCHLPRTALRLLRKSASQQCWERQLGTSHNISGGDMGDRHGGRSTCHLVSLYPTGNLFLDDYPQPPFLVWERPSLFYPPLPPIYIYLSL